MFPGGAGVPHQGGWPHREAPGLVGRGRGLRVGVGIMGKSPFVVSAGGNV